MSKIHFDFPAAGRFFAGSLAGKWQGDVQRAHDGLHRGTGQGQDFLGWLEPLSPDSEEVAQIEQTADRIRQQADVLLVIGIGGSYSGARAGIELLTPSHFKPFRKRKTNAPHVYFLGHNLSASYIVQILSNLDDQEVAVNVISKSGTTIEPALAFRIVRDWLIKRYGAKEAAMRIVATTDQFKGALLRFAEVEGYRTLVIPAHVGGRYSVLTAVGLLPMCVAGLDIRELLRGAQDASVRYATPDVTQNHCYQYAVWRNELYRQGRVIELLAAYEPAFAGFAEWWKQLFGESEGKNGKGIFPASVQFSTDLHSLGQYVQEGPRHLFETVLWVEDTGCEVLVPAVDGDLDGLNYLAGKGLTFVNEKAWLGTIEAHESGAVPNLLLQIGKLDERHVGHLFYFFEKACALSGYLLGVNPFDQPGVEAYKQNMFKLLGKPGRSE
ncbi:glucose-6-phosphate isomerase [Tumebacillus algifaecis]|uniref:Glucose-6-phosphate isomerase n=1 Tax=Tumebacillus algifaecis TaxID=1214604 RepID=A0A223D5S9_9BACL|nr:glucose-6-phosphate isomerase [Tumebacillus algifaecis]ASS76724.1 glucose-6-phosphate isomerase [Tumebacillus algifaecis]